MPEPDDLPPPRTERMPARADDTPAVVVPTRVGILERTLALLAAAALSLPWYVFVSRRASSAGARALGSLGLEPLVLAVAIGAVFGVFRGRPAGSRALVGLGVFGLLWQPYKYWRAVDGREDPRLLFGVALLVAAAGVLMVLGNREVRRDPTEVKTRRAARPSYVAAFGLPAMAYLSSVFDIDAASRSPDDAVTNYLWMLFVSTSSIALVGLSLASRSPRRSWYRLAAVPLWLVGLPPVISEVHRSLGALGIALLAVTMLAPASSIFVLYYDASRGNALERDERRAAWAAPLPVVVAMAMLLVAFFALAWLPDARIEAGRGALEACDDVAGDPDSPWAEACRARAVATFAWTKRLPWTRARAERTERDAAHHHQRSALRWNTFVSPQRRGRDDALRTLCKGDRDIAESVGAFEVAATCAGRPLSAPSVIPHIAPLALAADLDAIAEAAENPSDLVMTELRRAALQCLLGKPRDAIPWLRARASAASEVAYACGLGSSELGFEPSVDMDLAFALTAHARPNGRSAAEALRAAKPQDRSGAVFLIVLARALEDGDASAADALRGPGADFLADPAGAVDATFSATGATPWRLVGELRRFAAIPTDALERGAGRLEALATAPMRKDEERALIAEARAMWLLAAQERIRRGDPAGATAGLARADALAERRTGLWSSAVHLALHDGAGALAQADAFLVGAQDPLDRAVATMQRAVAFILMKKRDDAATAAASAAALLSGYEAKTESMHGLVRASAWLACSTSLRSSFPTPAGVAAMTIVPFGKLPWDAERDRAPANLCGKAVEGAPQRQALRARFTRVSVGTQATAEFGPAAFDVVAALAEGAHEPSVWLDAAMDHDLGIALRGTMLIRADAARWRGDLEDAQRWDERFERIAHLVRDERTALLASYVGW